MEPNSLNPTLNPMTLAKISYKALSPIVINVCNGESPVLFSEAWISCTSLKAGYPVALIYQDGLKKLFEVLLAEERGTTSTNEALTCVQKYILEDLEKHTKCLASMKDLTAEVEVQAVLAAHLFGPLLPEYDDVLKCCIDKQHLGSRKSAHMMKCPTCDEKIPFGNTSFGNSKVWHGTTDILLQKSTVMVHTESEVQKQSTRKRTEMFEADSDSDASVVSTGSSSSTSSAVEIRTSMCTTQAEHQAIAQAITNAFCEVNKYGLHDVFIPSFLATSSHVKVYMYCCSKDGLLESDSMPLFQGESFDISTLITIWLSINFDRFELVDLYSDKMKYVCPQSRFQKVIGESANIMYEKELCKPLKCDKVTNIPKDYDMNFIHASCVDFIEKSFPFSEQAKAILQIEEKLSKNKVTQVKNKQP